MESPPSPTSNEPAISAETLLAVRHYNQEVASYTLRQWNVAKLEAEKKDRDRRKRRGDMLAQQRQRDLEREHQQHSNSSSTGAGTGHAYPNSSTSAGSRSSVHTIGPGPRPADTLRPHSEPTGPLMMVSKRRTERDRVGMSGITSSGPAQSGYRPSHDHHPARYDLPNRAHSQVQNASIHKDIERLHRMESSPSKIQTQSNGSLQLSSVNRTPNATSSSARTADVLANFSYPTTHNHFKANTRKMTSLSLALDGKDPNPDAIDDEEDDDPLPLPPRVWQHRRSGSTPPIPIPRPSATSSQQSDTGSLSTSSSGGGSSGSGAFPARALRFSAHLGMTSISNPLSTLMTDSASTSNNTSEGSSRMSSFSEANGGMRQGVAAKKLLTDEGDTKEVVPRPTRRHHRNSLATVATAVAERAEQDVSASNSLDKALGALRRMTISGGERAMFGPLEH